MWVVCAKCGKQFVFNGGTDTATYRICKDCRSKAHWGANP